jgi:glutamine phosphoribosylpyrophosphate amidotransferase
MCKYFGVYLRIDANDKLKDFVSKGATYGNFGCGIMLYDGKELYIKKQVKPLSQFEWDKLPKFKVGAFHLRLPSVGKVEIKNAHPFIACNKTFALMHNGTFIHYKLFKKLLQRIGNIKHKFISETDSEVIMHLVEEAGYGVLKDLEERVIILTNDGRMIGYGGYIIKDKEGYYIANEEDNFLGMFEGQRKRLIDVERALWEIRNGKLFIKGKAKSEIKLLQKSYVMDLRNYYYWYKGNESWYKGGEKYGIDFY